MMCSPLYNYRSSSLSPELLFRHTFLSSLSLLTTPRIIAQVFRETGGNRPLVMVLSLAVLASGLIAPAAKAQTVINFPGGVTSATGI
jgi:hypothetical protein